MNSTETERSTAKRFFSLNRRPRLYSGQRTLDPTHQRENDQDDEDKTKSTSRSVAPLTAVRPGGENADEKEDQDNEEDGAHD